MATYGSSTPYPPNPSTRPRQASNLSRYVPGYQAPQPAAAPPSAAGYPHANGKPAPLTPMPTSGQSPMCQPSPYLHPTAAAQQPPYPVVDGYMSAPPVQPRPVAGLMSGRKDSYSSYSSRRSRDSRHSRADSYRSHRSHHSKRSTSDEEYEAHKRRKRRERRARQERENDDGRSEYKVTRRSTPRPTIGDTIFTIFGGLKGFLAPKDR